MTAAALIAVFLPTLFLASNFTWAIMMLAVSVVAIVEWAKLIDLPQSIATTYGVIYALLGGLLLWGVNYYGSHWLIYQSLPIFGLSALFWLLFVPVLLKKCMVVENKTALMVIGLLIITPLLLALIFAKSVDPLLLLALLATIWIADSAAYFAGKRFGKRKLAPSISPGKTWEGVLGALVAVSVFGAVLYLSGLSSYAAVIPLLCGVAVLGVVGDLFESLIKRQFNKKDSGNILPGHGGILDRIDGLLPSLPIAVLAIYLFHYFQAVS